MVLFFAENCVFWSGVAVDGSGKDHAASISLYKTTGKVKVLDEEIYSMLSHFIINLFFFLYSVSLMINPLRFVLPENNSIDFDAELDTHFGIAHTRWATHGEPSPLNSHPHRSDKNNGKT